MNLSELPGPSPTYQDRLLIWIQDHRGTFLACVTAIMLLLAFGIQILERQRQAIYDLTYPLIFVGDNFRIEAHYKSAVEVDNKSEIRVECAGIAPSSTNDRFDFEVKLMTTDAGAMDASYSSKMYYIEPFASCEPIVVPFRARNPQRISGPIAFEIAGVWNGSKLTPTVLRVKLLRPTPVSYAITGILAIIAALTPLFGSKLIDRFLGTKTS